MFIEDGTGSGRKALVDEDFRLGVSARTQMNLEHVNEDTGQVFVAPLSAVAPSGATFFFVFQNNGQSTYAVSSITLASSVAGVFRVVKATGTPVGGTAVTPVSLNFGAVVTLDTVTVQTGASITGLTNAGDAKLWYIQANNMLIRDIPARIYLLPGTTLALIAPAAATVNGTVEFYKEDV